MASQTPDEPLLQSIESFNIERVETQLKALVKTNRDGVVVFAARAALRTFPFINNHQDESDFWSIEKDANYLLAVWRALLMAWLNDNYVVATYTTEFASGFVSGPATAAADALDAAAAFLDEDVVSFAARAAAYSYKTMPDVISAIAWDIQQLQKGEKLRGQLLWPTTYESPDTIYKKLEKQWPEMINGLINTSVIGLEKECLEDVEESFWRFWDGAVDTSTLIKELKKLNRYFREHPTNKLSKKYRYKNTPHLEKNSHSNKSELDPKISNPEADQEAAAPVTPRIIDHYSPSAYQKSHQASTVDNLNRQKLVEVIAKICATPKNHHHQTIGLLGDWGVGKTTFLNLLKTELQQHHKEQPFLFASFNAWEYEHTDNLQAGIAQEMISALSSAQEYYVPAESADLSEEEQQSIQQAKRKNQRENYYWWFKKRILMWRFAIALHKLKLVWPLLTLLIGLLLPIVSASWLTQTFKNTQFELAIGGLIWAVGLLAFLWKQLKPLMASPQAKEWLTYLKLPEYGEHLGTIPVMRKHIQTLANVRLNRFGKTPKRLVYIVDDLDRCGPEGIVNVFEAVRLVLDLKQVIVIIAVDHKVALAALALHYEPLSKHYPSGNAKMIARDYLAKIIHLPIVLSPPDQDSIENYLHYLWDEGEGERATSDQLTDDLSTPMKPVDINKAADMDEAKSPELDDDIGRDVDPEVEQTEVTAEGQDDHQDQLTSTALEDELEVEENTEVNELVGIWPSQKVAFHYWINYFGLSNPRQLKRLNHSYQLVRHFFEEDELITVDHVDDEELQPLLYPKMVTLFALEYINQLESPEKRKSLKQALDQNRAGDELINQHIATIANHVLAGHGQTLLKDIDPFVLPAIDAADEALSVFAGKAGPSSEALQYSFNQARESSPEPS